MAVTAGKCADESNGMEMQSGDYVTANNGKYVVQELLGQGGYGAVYKVLQEGSNKFFALKAEKKMVRRDHSKLNMEVFILKAMSEQAEEKSHYTKIYDKARKKNFYLIVMTLVGESLAELKKRYYPPVFSKNTGYAVSMQCLEALEELHKIGFIHRDLKPGNFAIGLEEKMRLVYILDFGIARRILNDKNEIKAPRVKVPFKGTVRFAPLASHESKELGFKDDCETWFYMMADMMNPKGLPWKMEKDKDAVMEHKRIIRTEKGKERLFYDLSLEELTKGFEYVTGLHYTDRINYEFLYTMTRQCGQRGGFSLQPPYDWEIDSATNRSDETTSTDSTNPATRKQQQPPPKQQQRPGSLSSAGADRRRRKSSVSGREKIMPSSAMPSSRQL